jgi:hypothetical protein
VDNDEALELAQDAIRNASVSAKTVSGYEELDRLLASAKRDELIVATRLLALNLAHYYKAHGPVEIEETDAVLMFKLATIYADGFLTAARRMN